jgi:hypothetical protein
VRNPHCWIIGEIELESVGDLLGTPGRCPAPILAPPVSPTDPPNVWTSQQRAVQFRHGASQTLLHVLAERSVDGELRHFRAPSTPIGMPLGSQGTIFQIAAAGRGVPSQFSRDRRWRAVHAPGDCSNAVASGAQERDVLPLDEG